MINKFDDLKILKESHLLTLNIYRLTKSFPVDERFRLTDQLCRSASSVPANIAEGNSRKTKKEFVQFLYQAKGSLSETQYHLMLANDLGLISQDEFVEMIISSDQIGKMISGLISYLCKSTI